MPESDPLVSKATSPDWRDRAGEALLRSGDDDSLRLILRALHAADDDAGEHLLWAMRVYIDAGHRLTDRIEALRTDQELAVGLAVTDALEWLGPD